MPGSLSPAGTSSSAMAERPRDACSVILRGWVTLRLNFRLKGYVSRQHLWTVKWGNGYTTPCLKTVQNCFCQNFVKFPPILIIFGRMMAKRLKLCEMYSFSTSTNSHHHTTVLNAMFQIVTQRLHNAVIISIRLFTFASSVQWI